MSLVSKIALLASSLLIGATLILFFLVRNSIESTVVQREEAQLTRALTLAAHELRSEVQHAASDVQIAARTPAMTSIVDTLTRKAGTPEGGESIAQAQQRLADHFLEVLAANPTYVQLRLIGIKNDGQELVRVERTAQGIVRTPDNRLQQKGDRPYFKGTLALEPGTAYISEINLNQENGKVVEPHQPVVRVGTAVTTAQGVPIGIVMLNVDVRPLLEQIDAMSLSPLALHLITDEGDYLSTPDVRKAFGFDLGQRHRIQHELPWLSGTLRKALSATEPLIVRNGDIIAEMLCINVGEMTARQQWVLVGTIDLKEAMSSFLSFRYVLLITVVTLILLGITGSIAFARHLTKPLRRLTDALQGVGQGQFDTPIGAAGTGTREFAELRSAFETMREAIQNREQSLRDAHARIEAVIDNATNPIITIDERGHILHVNKSACAAFGYAAWEMEGHNAAMLMPSPYREEHDQYLEDYRTTGLAKVIGKGREAVALRKDGSTFPIELGVASVMLATGRTYIGTITDLTAVKALQHAKIEKMEEALKLEQLKGEFVATINHELRTPLTSIIGSLALVTSNRLGKLPLKARSMIDIACTNGERLSRLVNDILDLEKLVAGKMPVQSQSCDLATLLQETVRSNAGYGDRYGIPIKLKPPLPDVTLHTDPDRLLQVLANLISNAVKYSPPGASVVVSAKLAKGGVRISVADKGPGIPEEFRHRLFTRFAQADSSDARKRGGTGLGLSITKAIVEALGGTIDFTTAMGKGTTFHLHLPVDAAVLAEPQQMQPAPRAAAS